MRYMIYTISMRYIILLILFFVSGFVLRRVFVYTQNQHQYESKIEKNVYWMELHRKSEREYVYKGVPGDVKNSNLVRMMSVKVGESGKRPTPLPQLSGKKYWRIIDKLSSHDNPETAPYFLTLDIPSSDEWPYGPMPYEECSGQCDWETMGYFGLHGVNGDLSRLSAENPGSSGCVRHRDDDITFLYKLLDPAHEEVRYYIQDI